MNAQIIDWSDIPFILAVCEIGSLSGAARSLGVNHSTVFRRIEGVEAKLGARLFERLPQGYVMTTAGEQCFQHLLRLREAMNGLQRELGGHDFRLEGKLSITTTDSLFYCLSPFFSEFQRSYPAIEMRLNADTRSLNLMNAEADIALRPTATPPEHWVGRKLATIDFGVYAHKDYWISAQAMPNAEHHWICFEQGLNQSTIAKLTAKSKHPEAKFTRANTMMGVFGLVQQALGVAVLPCYLANRDSNLVLIDSQEKTAHQLWLLAHPDMRYSAKVQAFLEFASQHIAQYLSLSD